MSTSALQSAEHFLKNETQFHLGMLPTEQSNPKTKTLERTFNSDTPSGVELLLSVDRDITCMARKVLASNEYRKMVDTAYRTVTGNGRIIFSGCGATGRLSILLETMWRRFFVDLKVENPAIYAKVAGYEDAVYSIMTGGDFALIRSVESFEDYAEFGRQQVRELNIKAPDMLVAITEGGETSSVLGSLDEALNRGAAGFLMFNNPAKVLCEYIERSRKAIEDERVTVLDLFCGPMALAGSTRMQATTSEQLIAGSMLEQILAQILQDVLNAEELDRVNWCTPDYAAEFAVMLGQLASPENADQLAKFIDYEAEIYRQNGLVTYFADNYLLDIFTDTTERNPTFMLPPFAPADNPDATPSWAFVKHPQYPTDKIWEQIFGRKPRCLNWDIPLYKKMDAPAKVIAAPPEISLHDFLRIKVGCDHDPARISRQPNAAITILGSREIEQTGFPAWNDAFKAATGKFQDKKTCVIGQAEHHADFFIKCAINPSPLRLIERLAVKLTLNTLSTGTMVGVGRVADNWMSWVSVSNKKLIDRGIRLISELCSMSYRDACHALFESMEELSQIDFSGREEPSPVQHTIQKYKA